MWIRSAADVAFRALFFDAAVAVVALWAKKALAESSNRLVQTDWACLGLRSTLGAVSCDAAFSAWFWVRRASRAVMTWRAVALWGREP